MTCGAASCSAMPSWSWNLIAMLFPTIFRHAFRRFAHLDTDYPHHIAALSERWREGPKSTHNGSKHLLAGMFGLRNTRLLQSDSRCYFFEASGDRGLTAVTGRNVPTAAIRLLIPKARAMQ